MERAPPCALAHPRPRPLSAFPPDPFPQVCLQELVSCSWISSSPSPVSRAPWPEASVTDNYSEKPPAREQVWLKVQEAFLIWLGAPLGGSGLRLAAAWRPRAARECTAFHLLFSFWEGDERRGVPCWQRCPPEPRGDWLRTQGLPLLNVNMPAVRSLQRLFPSPEKAGGRG